MAIREYAEPDIHENLSVTNGKAFKDAHGRKIGARRAEQCPITGANGIPVCFGSPRVSHRMDAQAVAEQQAKGGAAAVPGTLAHAHVIMESGRASMAEQRSAARAAMLVSSD